MDTAASDETFFEVIKNMFHEKIPFNKVLDCRVESIGYDSVQVSILARDELLGHYERGMLHGGVISSVIDQAGGLSALMGLQKRMVQGTLEQRLETFDRVSTLDLRVDFLRPGLGKRFVAKAFSLRTGSKVAVTRIELTNEQNELIAVGTGSYVVV